LKQDYTFLANLNKQFENRVRLGIMSLLMVNDWVHYSAMKEALSAPEAPMTDGNLASHLKALLKHKYVEDKKEFVNKKPHTTYRATSAGRKAFEAHLDALETMLKQSLEGEAGSGKREAGQETTDGRR
jgi:DNA-binding PadR family transcriptional regulator